ncbi:hypothetical protein DPMN_167544 [Dreissena polymorpha]|uniref:Uncharacterized protein n=1 Tax=Dreissena polymorpha TaxID=45954 RepID=A0A9D4IV50_DREPO|nr:hypothetical protein DPMN_167544 [Dreissena polymorpha]
MGNQERKYNENTVNEKKLSYVKTITKQNVSELENITFQQANLVTRKEKRGMKGLNYVIDCVEQDKKKNKNCCLTPTLQVKVVMVASVTATHELL